MDSFALIFFFLSFIYSANSLSNFVNYFLASSILDSPLINGVFIKIYKI